MKRNSTVLLYIVSTLLLIAGCSKTLDDPLNWKVAEFSYTDQNNETFRLQDLNGKVWVADFIFTSCETVCPPMTANMTKLQSMLKQEGIEDVEFVSFSVDPVVDTPEKLKQFMGNYDLDASNWHFLTGYSQEEITAFAFDSFQTLVNKPSNSTQVTHGTSLYLVDQSGNIVRSYSAYQNTPYEQIIEDIKIIR